VIYALRLDGTAAHWGSDSPQYQPPGGVFTHIAASNVNACGLRPGGSVECWGAALISPLPAGTYLHVDGYDQRRYCGVRDDGIIFCWDNGFYEQPPR
jgi:hypothetical protein